MNLKGKQADIIDALGNARGVVTFTQGPPGTGRTHTVARAFIPHLCSSNLGIHLILSPSNASADGLAVSMDTLVSKMRSTALLERHPHMQQDNNIYVIRLL